MGRLIDANKLKEAVMECAEWWENADVWIVNTLIDEAPTVEIATMDLAEHGEWIRNEQGLVICSKCLTEAIYQNSSSWYDDYEDENGNDGSGYVLAPYCPWCGRKMKEVSK